MIRFLSILAAAVIIGVALGRAAHGQTQCAPRAEVVKAVAEGWREAPVAIGIINSSAVLEIFAGPDGATWTVIITGVTGMSCVIASGQAWQRGPLPTKGENP